MLNVSQDLLEQIKDAICRPEGSITFEYSSPIAFKKGTPAGILMQIQSGEQIFRLERTDKYLLNFFHYSPGTGTRMASINLRDLPDFDHAFLAFTWSPTEIQFYCGPKVHDGSLVSAKGEPSLYQFRVGENGSIFKIGDEGIQIMGIRVCQTGKPILIPTAIESWRSTLKAIDVLWTGKSDQGFIFESVIACLIISVLVTGLETYAKFRFCELEKEGINPDINALFTSFASKVEHEANIFKEIEQEASASGASVLKIMVEKGKINFQNYDHIKRAYKKAYGIKLGEISIPSQVLSDLQQFIEYRHRIVHVSPLLGILNEEKVPHDEPVFAYRELGERAVKCFDELITKLHNASLTLKREDC